MSRNFVSCQEAKRLDMVRYLSQLGYQPKTVRGSDYWYLSPFREERTPSFKINSKLNVWYDHGVGQGGTLIDFGIIYYKCSIKEFLIKLESPLFLQQPMPAPQIESQSVYAKTSQSKIKILAVRSISSRFLKNYLSLRQIPVFLAMQFCKEIDFELYGRTITTLGFGNRSGGFELRSPKFKGSSSPKDISLISDGQQRLFVFEGFFSFLSFYLINAIQDHLPASFLILNSLALLEKSRGLMDQHEKVFLHLDRDQAGQSAAQTALRWGEKYRDESHLYGEYKDWNECLKDHHGRLKS